MSHKGACPGSPHCPGGDDGGGGGGEEPLPADPAIAYIAARPVKSSTVYDLMVMNADGSNQTVLLTESGTTRHPDWSPDLDGNPDNGYQGTIAVGTRTSALGSHILLVDVSVVEGTPQGGNVRVLVDENDPALSDPTIFGSSTGLAIEPAWSPDLDAATPGYQGQVAFTTMLTINVIDVAWNGTTVEPVLGPNSSEILFVAPNTFVPTMDHDMLWYPTWSPDGARLAFYIQPWEATNELVVMNSDGTGVTTVAQGDFNDLDWSRTDSRVAFWGLGTIDVDLGSDSLKQVQASYNARSPSWSSDDQATTVVDETDKFLVFAGQDSVGSKSTIRRVELATGEQTVLASSKKADLRWPDWRPFPSSGWAPASSSSAASSSTSESAAADVTSASFDASTSDEDSEDEAIMVAVASPAPVVNASDTGSTSTDDSDTTSGSSDGAEQADLALSDFDPGPLDDALLEDLAVALVG